MNILRVILATLVIFGTGAVSGYFVAKKQTTVEPREQREWRNSRDRGGRPSIDRMMDRMQRDLELTDEQRSTIQEIFAKSHERTRTLWREMREPMQAEVSRTHEEIKAVLDPEQAVKFDEINERNKRRREEFKKNRENRGEPVPVSDPGEQCSVGISHYNYCPL